MNVKLVDGFPITDGACSELHSGPLDAQGWCSVAWRLLTVDNIAASDYALVPANMPVLLPAGVRSFGRTDTGSGRFSKIINRPEVI